MTENEQLKMDWCPRDGLCIANSDACPECDPGGEIARLDDEATALLDAGDMAAYDRLTAKIADLIDERLVSKTS